MCSFSVTEPTPVAAAVEIEAAPKARLYRFSKKDGTFGIEVHNHADQFGNSKYIKNMAGDGPAKAAGVKDDDRFMGNKKYFYKIISLS